MLIIGSLKIDESSVVLPSRDDLDELLRVHAEKERKKFQISFHIFKESLDKTGKADFL